MPSPISELVISSLASCADFSSFFISRLSIDVLFVHAIDLDCGVNPTGGVLRLVAGVELQ